MFHVRGGPIEKPMASLCLLNEEGATTQRWELGDRPLAVGRDNTSDIIVEDQTLSRRHFVIIRKAGEYLLNDLESQNGTFVDGHRVNTEPANCVTTSASPPAALCLSSAKKTLPHLPLLHRSCFRACCPDR